MRLRTFVALQSVLVAVGVLVLGYQRFRLRQIRQSTGSSPAAAESSESEPSRTAAAKTHREKKPSDPATSLEVLRLRAEVSRLRAEFDALSPEAKTAAREVDDWNQVWDGPKPSEQQGFRNFEDLAPEGWATPDAAYGSFQHAMRHQPTEALTPERMKQIFALPDDFDDPSVRYSLHLGQGMQGDRGYRVVRSEVLEPGLVKLVVEIESKNGRSFREERVMVESGGRWRVRPEGVERLPDLPPGEAPDSGATRTVSEPVLLP